MLMATSAWAVLEDLTALECIGIDRKSGEHVWIKVFKDTKQTTNSGFNIPHLHNPGKDETFLPQEIRWWTNSYGFRLQRESLVLSVSNNNGGGLKGRYNCTIYPIKEWNKRQDDFLRELTKDNRI